MTTRLQTREARSRLKKRAHPYWLEVHRGLAIGYRKGETGGWWLVREYRGGRYTHRRLGASDDTAPADGDSILSWKDALKLASGEGRPTVTQPGKLRLRDAWEEYAQTRAVPPDARERAIWAQFIQAALGDRPIGEITTHELEKWLSSQVTKHGQRRDSGETDPRERDRRAKDTANRRWTLLKAVLNSAFHKHPDQVPTDASWRRVKAYRKVGRARKRVATAAEAARLVGALPPGLQALARGSLYSGLRLSELLALRARDVTRGEVTVRNSKGGDARAVPLSAEGAGFFARITTGKLSDQLVFEPVHRVALSRAMKAASAQAEITPPVRFHDLRRSYGSALLNAGASLDTIRRLLGHADERMTAQTYAHLQQQVLRDTVTRLLPDFGGSTKVVPLRRGKRA